jgi:hypothetical protein
MEELINFFVKPSNNLFTMKKIYQTLLLSCLALAAFEAEAQTYGSYIGKGVALYDQGTTNNQRAATLDFKVVTVNNKTWAWTSLNNGSIDGDAGWVSQLRLRDNAGALKNENALTNRPSATASWGFTTNAPDSDGKISVFQNIVGSSFSETAFFGYNPAVANTPEGGDDVAPVLESNSCSFENVTQVSATLKFLAKDVNDFFYYIAEDGFDEVTFEASLQLTGLTPNTSYSFQVTAVDFSGNKSATQTITFNTPSSTVLTTPTGISIGADSVISFTGGDGALSYRVTVCRGIPASAIVDHTQELNASGAKLSFGIPGDYTVTVQAMGNEIDIVSSQVSENYEWHLENDDYTPPTLENSVSCMQSLDGDGKVLVTIEERDGLLWVELTPSTLGDLETSFRGGGFRANEFTLNGQTGTWFTKTESKKRQEVFTPISGITLHEGDVINYSGTIEWIMLGDNNAYKQGFTLNEIGGDYIWGSRCPRLSAPTNIAIDAERKLTFTEVADAGSYAVKVYNHEGALVCSQNVSSGDALPFDVPGAFTVIMQSLADVGDKNHFDSDTSLHYEWNLANTGRVTFPSGLWNTEVGAGDGLALWTWETVDTLVKIYIAAIGGKDPSLFHFRATNGLNPELFTVNGEANADQKFFTATNTSTTITLTPVAGAMTLGDVVSYSGMVTYRTEDNANLYPTINFGDYGTFVYGAKGPTLFPPENISVDADRLLTFDGDDNAGSYEVKIYNAANLPVATQTVAASGEALIYDVPGSYTLTVQSLAATAQHYTSVASAPYAWTNENEDEARYPSTFCGFTVNPAGNDDNDKAVFTWETRDGKLVVTISDADGNFDTYFREKGLQINGDKNSFKVNGVAGDWFSDGVPNGVNTGYTVITYEPKQAINQGDQVTFNGIVEYKTGLAVDGDNVPLGLWPTIDFGTFGAFTWGTTCDYSPQVNVSKSRLVFSPDTGIQSFVLSAEKLTAPLAIEVSKGLQVSPAAITPNANGEIHPTVVNVTWEEGSSNGFVRISGGGLAFAKEIPVASHRFSEYCNKLLYNEGVMDAPIYLTIAEKEDKTELYFTLAPVYGASAQWNGITNIASNGQQTLNTNAGNGSATVTATFAAALNDDDIVTFGEALVWTAGRADGTVNNNAFINAAQTYTVGAGGCALTTPHPAVYPEVASAEVHSRANTSATLKIAANEDAATYSIHAVRLREANGLLPLQEPELAVDSLYTLEGLAPATAYSLEIWAVDENGYPSALHSLSFATRDVPVLDSFEYALPDGDITYDGAEHEVNVTAKSGVAAGIGAVAVKYNASGEVPVNVGNYAVTLEVAQGEDFMAGTFDLGSFSIVEAPVLADLLDYDTTAVTYDGALHPVAVAAKSAVAGLGTTITVKYNDKEDVPVDAGEYLVTVDIDKGSNYLAAADLRLGTLIIGKAAAISADSFSVVPASATYSGAPQPAEVNVNAGVHGLGSITTVLYNGSKVAPVNAGRYGVTVNLSEGINYLAGIVELPDSFEVSKATLTADHLRYTPKSVQYDGDPHEVSVTLIDPYTGLGDITVKYNGSEDMPTDVDTYAVTVSVAEGDNFSATTVDIALGDFVVSSKSLVTLAELNYDVIADVTYDGSPHTVAVTAKQGVTLGGISVLYNDSAATPVNAGRYVIKVEVAESDDYALTELELPDTLKILKAPVLADLLDYDTTAVEYDGASHAVTVAAKSAIVGLGTITVKYSGSEAEPVDAGEYLVTVDVAEGSNYLAAADLRLGTLIITEVVIGKLPVTLAELDYDVIADVTYDGSPHELAVTATSGITLGEISVLYNDSAATPVNAGRYVIKVEVAESDDYALTELELPDTLTILKAPVLVDLLDYDTTAVAYDEVSHAVAVAAKPAVIGLGAITVKYNGSEAEPVDAGEYLVTVDVAEGSNYLAAADLRLGTLIITEVVIGKLPVTLAELDYAISDSVAYDGATHAVAVAAKEGVVGLGAITVKYNGSEAVPVEVGVYLVTADVAEGDSYLAAADLALGQLVIYAAPVVEPPTAVEHSSASLLSAYVADGVLHVSGEVESVRMVNTSGTVVLSARIAAGQTLSVAHLPAGIYFVLLQGKIKAHVVKLHVVN